MGRPFTGLGRRSSKPRRSSVDGLEMSRAAKIVAFVATVAIAGICYAALSPSGPPVVDCSSEAAFHASVGEVQRSVPREHHGSFEVAVMLLAKTNREDMDGKTGMQIIAIVEKRRARFESELKDSAVSSAMRRLKMIEASQTSPPVSPRPDAGRD